MLGCSAAHPETATSIGDLATAVPTLPQACMHLSPCPYSSGPAGDFGAKQHTLIAGSNKYLVPLKTNVRLPSTVRNAGIMWTDPEAKGEQHVLQHSSDELIRLVSGDQVTLNAGGPLVMTLAQAQVREELSCGPLRRSDTPSFICAHRGSSLTRVLNIVLSSFITHRFLLLPNSQRKLQPTD